MCALVTGVQTCALPISPYSDQFSIGLRTRFGNLQVETGFNYVATRNGFVYLLGNRRPDGSFFFDDPADPNDTPNSPFGSAPPGYGSIIIGDTGAETATKSAYVKMPKTYRGDSPDQKRVV